MDLTNYEKAKKNLYQVIENEADEIFKSIIGDCEGVSVHQTRLYLIQLVKGNGINKEIEYAIRLKIDKYVENLKITGL